MRPPNKRCRMQSEIWIFSFGIALNDPLPGSNSCPNKWGLRFTWSLRARQAKRRPLLAEYFTRDSISLNYLGPAGNHRHPPRFSKKSRLAAAASFAIHPQTARALV